jgi:hypothetical protein
LLLMLFLTPLTKAQRDRVKRRRRSKVSKRNRDGPAVGKMHGQLCYYSFLLLPMYACCGCEEGRCDVKATTTTQTAIANT